VDLWMRDITPSDGLRRWFAHDRSKWEEFRERYFRELERKRRLVEELFELEKKYGSVTLLYSARDPGHNNAVALMEYLSSRRMLAPSVHQTTWCGISFLVFPVLVMRTGVL
jgi:uncharacterized protein YeaO (DUF488 family)